MVYGLEMQEDKAKGMMTMIVGDSPGAIVARKLRRSESSADEQLRLERKMMGAASPFPLDNPSTPRIENGISAEVLLCICIHGCAYC